MFAKNQQISHGQLYCQIVLTCAGVYLLCFPGWEPMLGRKGLWCLGIGLICFLFYCIFLVRISYVFSSLEKYFGIWGGRLAVLFFLVYLSHSGVFLLLRTEEIINRYLLDGVAAWLIILLCILVCWLGSQKGLQKRGRMAQVCTPALLTALFLMFLLSICKVHPSYLAESAALLVSQTAEGGYGVFCGFSPLFLLPFTLKQVEKPYSTGKTILAAVFTLAGILGLAFVLLQGTFGLYGTKEHAFPMIELMAGVDLPGEFIERMDVFWIIFLVFSLLFALGSVFFYSYEILGRTDDRELSFLIPILVFLVTAALHGREGAVQWYGEMLKNVYVPVFLIISVIAVLVSRRRKTV